MCHLYGIADCANAPITHRTLQYNCRSNPIQVQTLHKHHIIGSHFIPIPHSISLWNNLVISNDSIIFASFKRHKL